MLSHVSIGIFFVVIPLVLFIHEMEEWNIVKFHRENFAIQFDETNMSERLWLFILSLIGLFFSIICFNISNAAIANSIFLILVTFTLINGIQHLLMTILTKKYNPGFIFGGLLGTTFGAMYDVKLVAEAIVPLWVFIPITILIIPAMIDTAKSRIDNKLPAMIAQILRFSRFVERKMSEGDL